MLSDLLIILDDILRKHLMEVKSITARMQSPRRLGRRPTRPRNIPKLNDP